MQKLKTLRIPELLAAAEGHACIECGIRDGTVVAAHYNGLRQHRLGKGVSQKPHDLAVAFLCHDCHAEMDQRKNGLNKIEHSEEFLFRILETLVQLYRDGKLKFESI